MSYPIHVVTQHSSQEPVSGGAGGTGISGEVLCAMSYGSGHLTVHINRARGLSPSADYEPPSPYIEVLLLPEKDKNSAKQTVRKMKTCEPVFDCSVKVCLYNSVLCGIV